MALLLGLLAGLSATSAFLGPVAAPRRAAPLFVIETAPGPTEQEIFSEATSISGALAELWSVLANPPPPGDFRAMYFPQCECLKRPQTFQALFEHLEVCKDSSQNFGAHIHAMPGPVRRGVPGIFVDSSLDSSIARRHAIAAASSRCLIRAGRRA